MEYLQYSGKSFKRKQESLCFKPCYKWNTFNTLFLRISICSWKRVLNLVINGIPSILPNKFGMGDDIDEEF